MTSPPALEGTTHGKMQNREKGHDCPGWARAPSSVSQPSLERCPFTAAEGLAWSGCWGDSMTQIRPGQVRFVKECLVPLRGDGASHIYATIN